LMNHSERKFRSRGLSYSESNIVETDFFNNFREIQAGLEKGD